MAGPPDPASYRAESVERWGRAAPGWGRRREAFQRAVQPVSMWLVDALRPQPGHRVVEVACGPGDTGLLAAELVQPGGSVLLTDAAEPMVELARARVRELGASGVEAKAMDAEWLDLPAASADGLLCRFGLMLLADPGAALSDWRRVLRPGGRLALAVWAAAEANPWATVVTEALVAAGHAEPPDPGAPGMFALADRSRLLALLEGAGFTGAATEEVEVRFRYGGRDEVWEERLDLSPDLPQAVEALSPAEHARLRDAVDERLRRHAAADASVALPGRVLVAAADA